MYTVRDSSGALVDFDPCCWRCGRKLAVFAGRPYRFVCTRCHATCGSPNESEEIGAHAERTVNVLELTETPTPVYNGPNVAGGNLADLAT